MSRFLPYSILESPKEEPLALKESLTFIVLFAVLVIFWLGGFLVFHVASAMIHLLLIIAVISLILHFVRGRATS